MNLRYLENSHTGQIDFLTEKMELIKVISQFLVYPAPTSDPGINSQYLTFHNLFLPTASLFWSIFLTSVGKIEILKLIHFPCALMLEKSTNVQFFCLTISSSRGSGNNLPGWLHWQLLILEVFTEFPFSSATCVSLVAPSSVSSALSETTRFAFFLITTAKSHSAQSYSSGSHFLSQLLAPHTILFLLEV